LDTATLRFAIPEVNFTARRHPALPVDVHRGTDFAVVARVVTGEPVKIAPGDYVAVSRLPDGGSVSEPFSVSDDAGVIPLTKAADAISSYRMLPVDMGAAFESELSLRLIDFNPFRGEVRRDKVARPFYQPAVFEAPDDDGLRYVLLRRRRQEGDADTFLAAVPFPARSRSYLWVQALADGSPWPRFGLARAASTFIYEFMANGNGEAANRLSRSDKLAALDLVENKSSDPIAGAVGLYMLLNGGSDEDLEARCEKLYKLNENLADGCIIYSEFLFRQGRVAEAVDVLSTVRERGLPLLRLGFSMAIQRLELCRWQDAEVDGSEEIHAVYTAWARRLVSRSVTTVYRVDEGVLPVAQFD
jgi:hypothetical protein